MTKKILTVAAAVLGLAGAARAERPVFTLDSLDAKTAVAGMRQAAKDDKAAAELFDDENSGAVKIPQELLAAAGQGMAPKAAKGQGEVQVAMTWKKAAEKAGDGCIAGGSAGASYGIKSGDLRGAAIGAGVGCGIGAAAGVGREAWKEYMGGDDDDQPKKSKKGKR